MAKRMCLFLFFKSSKKTQTRWHRLVAVTAMVFIDAVDADVVPIVVPIIIPVIVPVVIADAAVVFIDAMDAPIVVPVMAVAVAVALFPAMVIAIGLTVGLLADGAVIPIYAVAAPIVIPGPGGGVFANGATVFGIAMDAGGGRSVLRSIVSHHLYHLAGHQGGAVF